MLINNNDFAVNANDVVFGYKQCLNILNNVSLSIPKGMCTST